MTISVPDAGRAAQHKPKVARDFQEHLADLEAKGLVVRVDRPINKDTELHPLARWQFQGAISEDKRRAFLFTNVVGSDGKKFEMRVRPEAGCSDGMSDKRYPIAVELTVMGEKRKGCADAL